MKIWALAVVLVSIFGQSISASDGKLLLVVSTDWEGRDLKLQNLAAMKNFRRDFPEVKIIQFLNAAYFTKPDADATQVRSLMNSVLQPGDELGLHIHGWKTLFEASNVTFRSSPTAWGNELQNCDYDCGHEVAINAYTGPEMRKVIHYSVDTLNAQGFGRATSFRAGAWMGDKQILDALTDEGFKMDSSEVPPELLQSAIEQYPFWSWIENLWKGVDTSVQPHVINTRSGSLLEVPDNGALADYMTSDQMLEIFKSEAFALARDPSHDVYVQIGFHEETAAIYLPRVSAAITAMKAEATRSTIPFAMASLPLH